MGRRAKPARNKNATLPAASRKKSKAARRDLKDLGGHKCSKTRTLVAS